MGRPKQAARDTERDGCPRAFNAKTKKNKQLPYGKAKKNKNGRIPGGSAGERRDAGRRTREANCGGNRGLEAGNWRIAGSRERGISGAGRALGIQGGNGTRRGERKMIR